MKKWRKSVTTASIAVGASLLAAACSSSGSSASSSPQTTQSAQPTSQSAQPATQSAKPATGSPITIGLINDASGTGGQPDLTSAVNAAVQYINSQLGGVNGDPIKLVSCDSQGTPEATSECAAQLIADHPAAIIAGQVFSMTAATSIFEQSGIALVTNIALSAAQFATKGSFVLAPGGGGGMLAADDYAIHTLHASKLSVLYLNDMDASISFAQNFIQKPMEAAGVKVQLAGLSLSSPDATSALTVVASSHPNVVYTDILPTQYPSVMQLHAEEGVTAPIIYQSLGLDPKLTTAGGAGANGSLITYDYTPFTDTSDPQVAVFVDSMKKYAPSAGVNGGSQTGFASMMDTYNVLKTLSGVPSAAQVMTAFQNSVSIPGFMSHSFGCKTPAIPSLFSLCDPYDHVIEYKNGTFTVVGGNNNWYSGAGLVK